MNICLFAALCFFCLPFLGQTDEPPKMEQIERLVRNDAFSDKPNLNTKTEFHIRKLEVKGLWEELKLQVYDIEYLIQNQPFNGYVALYHDGKITVLASNLGGSGLMSGVMCKDEFYFTYSWGSGIHRSHLAKLQLIDGKLKRWESGGFMDKDIFASCGSDGNVHVLSGVFDDFNRWSKVKEFGTVRAIHSWEIQIVDTKGKTIEPNFPYQEEK